MQANKPERTKLKERETKSESRVKNRVWLLPKMCVNRKIEFLMTKTDSCWISLKLPH